jgi:hypothetical protein
MIAVMADTAIELLDRQHERLQTADGAEFVHELRRFYEFITAGPDAVVSALGDLRAEAASVVEAFAQHDSRLVPDLAQLKADLVARVPEADDSGVPRPNGRFSRPDPAWTYGFANFDQVATGGPATLARDAPTTRSLIQTRTASHKIDEQLMDAQLREDRCEIKKAAH